MRWLVLLSMLFSRPKCPLRLLLLVFETTCVMWFKLKLRARCAPRSWVPRRLLMWTGRQVSRCG